MTHVIYQANVNPPFASNLLKTTLNAAKQAYGGPLPSTYVRGPLDVSSSPATYYPNEYGVNVNYVSSGHNAGLLEDRDYVQRVYYNVAGFPAQSLIVQAWPAYSGADLRGFPCVQYLTARRQLSGISTFSVDYQCAISESTGDYAVALDMFFWADAISETPIGELYIGLYIPAAWGGTSNQSFDFDSISPCSGSTVFNDPVTGFTSVHAVAGSSLAALTGPINIKSCLDLLQANGILTGNEYINGIEVGVELRQHTGICLVDHFQVQIV